MFSGFHYYKGRRVLITGHTGFKGSWLTHWLKLLGADVCGIALLPDTTPSIFDLIHGADGILSHQFDLGDGAATAHVIKEFQPEIIFHLAAQSLVRRSYAQPVRTFMSNVMGTAHVLEAARSVAALSAVVIVTSDKVYKNVETGKAFMEDDPLGGHDPYSASKACTEIVTESWRSSFFQTPGAANIATARAGNVFGGGDWSADRLLPDIARAIADDKPITLRNPAAIRPWQYVLEALSGYLMLGVRLGKGDAGFSESWNFGPLGDEAITAGEFARRIIEVWGRGGILPARNADQPREAHTLRLDSSKSASRLGWKPVLPLSDAIKWSVDWYRAVLADPARAAAISTDQIEAFSRYLE